MPSFIFYPDDDDVLLHVDRSLQTAGMSLSGKQGRAPHRHHHHHHLPTGIIDETKLCRRSSAPTVDPQALMPQVRPGMASKVTLSVNGGRWDPALAPNGVPASCGAWGDEKAPIRVKSGDIQRIKSVPSVSLGCAAMGRPAVWIEFSDSRTAAKLEGLEDDGLDSQYHPRSKGWIARQGEANRQGGGERE